MKIVRILLIGLVALGISIFTWSLFYSSFELKESIVVESPLIKSYLVFNDVTKLDLWVGGLNNVEHTGGDLFMIGSTYLINMEIGGVKEQVKAEITRNQPNKNFSVKMENDDIEADVSVSFSDTLGNTLIQTNADIKAKNFFSRCRMPFFKPVLINYTKENLSDLKTIIQDYQLRDIPLFGK